jgi:predicted acylesterase/phospholipase RssA
MATGAASRRDDVIGGPGAGGAEAAVGGISRPLRVGLALSSGGARGFAHVGVIKGLRAAGCTITAIAGSSIGAIVAAGYAIHADADALERWVLDFRARDHARGRVPIMDPVRLTAFLDRTFGGAEFADCAVPLRIVATDLVARVAVTLDSGPLATAAFASSTLPFLHRPIVWGERLLADGALSCVLPLAQAAVPGVDLIVGSLVSRPRAALNGLSGGLARTAGSVVRGWGRPYVEFFRARAPQPPWPGAIPASPALPTLILTPRLDRLGALDFARMREAIAAGEAAVAAVLGEWRGANGA